MPENRIPRPSFTFPALMISLPSAHSRPCTSDETLATTSFGAPLNSADLARNGWILSGGTLTRMIPSRRGGGAVLASGNADAPPDARLACESPMRIDR